MDEIVEIIRHHAHPLEPRATGLSPRLDVLPEIRAVLFDIYGTMFVSGSGDISVATIVPPEEAMRQALAAMRLDRLLDSRAFAAEVKRGVSRGHQQARDAGIDWPEVDFVRIWREAAETLLPDQPPPETDVIQRLIVHFEMRANPVWPMPGLAMCLEQLRRRKCLLGLISNAQFYTLALFPALLDATPEDLGFVRVLQYYSFRFGRAKPSTHMFELATEALRRNELDPRQILYVGNDIRNDIWPASRVGMRTALFAGDARSLRLRRDDPNVADVQPDLVITDLLSLLDCISHD